MLYDTVLVPTAGHDEREAREDIEPAVRSPIVMQPFPDRILYK